MFKKEANLKINKDKKYKLVLTFIFSIFLLIMSLASFDFGITGDEADMNAYGDAILNYYLTGGKDTTCLNMPKIHDRDGILKYYGGGFDFVVANVKKISPFTEYNTRHLMNAIVGFIGIIFTSLITKRIAGTRAAIFAAFILFLSPRFFGHSMNNPKDIPFATAFTFAIWAIIVFLDNLENLKIKHVLFLGIAIASSIAIRFGGMLLIGYFLLFFSFELINKNGFLSSFNTIKKKSKQFIIYPVSAILIAYLGGVFFWPFGLLNPISHPFEALEKLGNLKVNIRQLFEGQQIFSSELPDYYLLKMIGITTPLLFIFGFFLAMILIVLKKTDNLNLLRIVFIAFSGIFPIFYIIYTDANVFHEWRHSNFAYPSLVIIAAFGWELLLRYFTKPVYQYVVIGVIAILAFLPAKFMLANHPYQYLYYNELQGGLEGANGEYVTDYWMQSMKEGSEWLIKNAKPKNDGTKLIIGTTAPVHVKIYLKDYLDRFEVRYVKFPQRHEKEWDYALFYADYINPKILKNPYAWPLNQTIHNIKTSNVTIGVVVKRPDNNDYLGLKAFNEQKILEARQYLEKAILQYPSSDVINFYLGYVYYAYQDRQNASLYLTRAAQLNPDFAPQANQILSAMK